MGSGATREHRSRSRSSMAAGVWEQEDSSNNSSTSNTCHAATGQWNLACLTDRKLSRPKVPSSRPKPLFFTPPHGCSTRKLGEQVGQE